MNRRSSISLIRRVLLLASVALFLGLATRAHSAEEPTPAPAPAASKPAPKKQFLIMLRLAPRLYDDKAWTDADKATVTAHFQRLKAATAAGQVLLAGRTPEPGDRTMGLVVFKADDEAAARAFMAGDPCVAAGVMLGELRPFGVALLGKN